MSPNKVHSLTVDDSSGSVYCFSVIFGLSASMYSVIKKDGLNFVSLYFKIRNSDKYDVNYI
jgi:hypothetical protein